MHALLVVAVQLVLTSIITFWHLCSLVLLRKRAWACSFGFPVLTVLHLAVISWVSFRTIPDCITLAILLVGFSLTRVCKVIACSLYFDEIMDAHGSLGRAALATLLDAWAPGLLVPSVAQKQRISSWSSFLEPAPPLLHQLRNCLVSYWIYDLLLEAAIALSHTAKASGVLDPFTPGSTFIHVLRQTAGATAKPDMASLGIVVAASAGIGFAQIFQFVAFHRIICFGVSCIYATVKHSAEAWGRLRPGCSPCLPDLSLPVLAIRYPWMSASLAELWGKRWHNFFKADFLACAYLPVQRMGFALCTAKHSPALKYTHESCKGASTSVPSHSKASEQQQQQQQQQQYQQQQHHHQQQQKQRSGASSIAGASADIDLQEGAHTTTACVSPAQKALVNTCAVLSCFLMSGMLHEVMNAASFGTHATTAGMQLCFFMLNGVGTVAERPLEAWGRAMGLEVPRGVQSLAIVTFMVSLGPLFAIPWIQAGYPEMMLRPVCGVRMVLDFLQAHGMAPSIFLNAWRLVSLTEWGIH